MFAYFIRNVLLKDTIQTVLFQLKIPFELLEPRICVDCCVDVSHCVKGKVSVGVNMYIVYTVYVCVCALGCACKS